MSNTEKPYETLLQRLDRLRAYLRLRREEADDGEPEARALDDLLATVDDACDDIMQPSPLH